VLDTKKSVLWGGLSVFAVIVIAIVIMGRGNILFQLAALVGIAEKEKQSKIETRLQHAREVWKTSSSKWNACLSDAENEQLRIALKNEQPREFHSTKASSLVWLSDDPALDVAHWRWGRVIEIHSGKIQYEGRYSIFPPDSLPSKGHLIEAVEYGWQEYIRLSNQAVLRPIDPVFRSVRTTIDGKREVYTDCLREPDQRPEEVPQEAVWIGDPFGEQAYVELLQSERQVPDLVNLRRYTDFRKMNGPVYSHHLKVNGPTSYLLLPPSGKIVSNINDLSLLRAGPMIAENGYRLVSVRQMNRFCDVFEAQSGMEMINIENRILISESYCKALLTIPAELRVER